MLDADAEVVLFTVPEGTRAMIGDSIPYFNTWYIEYEGEMDTTPELGFTFHSAYGDGAELTGSLALNSGAWDYQNTSVMSPIVGAGPVKVKVNTVPTGMTVCKVGLKTKVTW